MRRALIPLLLLAALSCSAQSTGVLFRTATVEGASYAYEVYVPPDWTPQTRWPVILFLHGAGMRGSYSAEKPETVIARLFLTYHKKLPAVVVFPRCPRGHFWNEAAFARLVMRALDQTMKEFGGDADRVYLTGLSMGGYGTWYLAGQFPERFAAIAPVCGGVRGPAAFPQLTMSRASDPYAEIARKVARLPIWIFHGEKDASVPVEESRRMHAALRALGADVRYSEYPGVGHDSWNNAYTEPGFLPWLLGQSKKKNRGTR